MQAHATLKVDDTTFTALLKTKEPFRVAIQQELALQDPQQKPAYLEALLTPGTLTQRYIDHKTGYLPKSKAYTRTFIENGAQKTGLLSSITHHLTK